MRSQNLPILTGTFLLVVSSVMCNLPSLTTPTPVPVTESGNGEMAATVEALQMTQTALAVVPGAVETNPSPAYGKISGKLSYPSEFIPPQRVVASNIDTGDFYFVDTGENQATYVIEDLQPGIYHLVAYVSDPNFAAGFSHAVPCGLSVDCTDHSLIEVIVNPGEETNNVDPGDWYAPDGTFPLDPTR